MNGTSGKFVSSTWSNCAQIPSKSEVISGGPVYFACRKDNPCGKKIEIV